MAERIPVESRNEEPEQIIVSFGENGPVMGPAGGVVESPKVIKVERRGIPVEGKSERAIPAFPRRIRLLGNSASSRIVQR